MAQSVFGESGNKSFLDDGSLHASCGECKRLNLSMRCFGKILARIGGMRYTKIILLPNRDALRFNIQLSWLRIT